MHPDLKDRAIRVIYFTLNLCEEIQGSPNIVDAKECRDNLLGLLDAIDAVNAPDQTKASVQYALAAWIDDLISRTDWTYARAWDAHPLETVLYGTDSRRWRFFELAEDALAREDWDALLVFQFCVNFGFRGIYAKDRVKVRAKVRSPMLRTRALGMRQSPAIQSVVPNRHETTPAEAQPALDQNIAGEVAAVRTGPRNRKYGPLLPATLADWCDKTFIALKKRDPYLGEIAVPGSILHQVFPIKRLIADWAIVMAIGVLLSAVLLAMGH